jgi:MFS transporter, OFA family, oxalate/formate antiporter
MAPIAALPRWFPDRPGFAYGVAFVGFGLGPSVNVPLMTGLLSATGGPLEPFYVLGVIYATLIGAAAWFVRYPLEDDGLAGSHPVGSEPSVPDHKTRGGVCVLHDAMKTWQLYALWVVFFLNTTARLASLSEAQPMAASIGGASAAVASAFVVAVSVTDAGGRLLWPALSDRIGGRAVFLAMFSLQARRSC